MKPDSRSLCARYLSSLVWFLSSQPVEIYPAAAYLGGESKMSLHREKKKTKPKPTQHSPVAVHVQLSSGETLDCCPFTSLPW